MTRKTVQKKEPEKPGAVGVLASGGADSSILLVELSQTYSEVLPVYVRNGLAWEEAEIHWLRRFLDAVSRPSIRPLEILDLPMQDVYHSHWSISGSSVPDHTSGWEEVYLPGRNLILVAKTAVFCSMRGIGTIALAPLKTNLFSDSSPAFFSGFQRVIEEALGRRFEIITPFAQFTKREVMEKGRNLPLELTFSCLSPHGMDHCGACNKCAERIQAYAEAGLKDSTLYRRPGLVPR